MKVKWCWYEGEIINENGGENGGEMNKCSMNGSVQLLIFDDLL
jgi:hypothetical protein